MGKQILQMESIHSTQGFAAKFKHNYRIGNVPNADPTLLHKNKQIIRLPVGETYNSFYEKHVMSLPYYANHKVHKNATLGWEIMMAYGTDNLPDNFSIDYWCQQSKTFLEDQFGKENIASAVLHMDENNPHIHAIIIPVKDGKLSARSYIKDRQDMRDLHVKYYDYMKECGLEPENRYMQTEHAKVGKFYANINMALEKSLPGPEEGETLPEYAERANAFYQDQSLRIFNIEHQNKQLTKEKKALEKANRTIEERTAKAYQSQIDEIIKQIGTVQNAKHAIQYRDSLQQAIEWTRNQDPEMAESIEHIITNMQHNYDRAVQNQDMEY